MPTIEIRRGRDGTETYRVKIRRRGAAALSRTFKRKTDARHWAHKMEVDIREGRHVPASLPRRRTLGEAIARYKDEVLPRKPRTAKFQTIQLDWWGKTIGHLMLADVTRSVIATARGQLMAAPQRGIAPGVRRPLTDILQCCRIC